MWYSPEKNETYETHRQIRQAFSNVLFPQEITSDHLDYVGVYPLVYEAPAVEPTQFAEPTMVLQIGDQWVQQWLVRDRTSEDPAPIDPEQN